MKKIINYLNLFLLFFGLFALSCSPESRDCNSSNCFNGRCKNGDCLCDDGYKGESCSEQIQPTSIKISKIKITKFPVLNGTNKWDNWDSTTQSIDDNPDLRIALLRGTSTLVYEQPDSFQNAVGSQTYTATLSPELNITQVLSQYSIFLYDADTFISYDTNGNPVTQDVDTYMSGLSFDLYQNTGGFPTTIKLTGSKVAFELTVSYTW